MHLKKYINGRQTHKTEIVLNFHITILSGQEKQSYNFARIWTCHWATLNNTLWVGCPKTYQHHCLFVCSNQLSIHIYPTCSFQQQKLQLSWCCIPFFARLTYKGTRRQNYYIWTSSRKMAVWHMDEMLCFEGGIEILIPVNLYMDGISLDVHGRLTLTPLTWLLEYLMLSPGRDLRPGKQYIFTQTMNFSHLLIKPKLILFTILKICTMGYERLYHLSRILAMTMPTLHGMNCLM